MGNTVKEMEIFGAAIIVMLFWINNRLSTMTELLTRICDQLESLNQNGEPDSDLDSE